MAHKIRIDSSLRDAQNAAILSVSCRFCHSFGREKVYRRTKNGVHIFVIKHRQKSKPPFCTDNFPALYRLQHGKKWDAFESLSTREKKTFFEVQSLFAETILAHFATKMQELIVHNVALIVDSIKKKMSMEDCSNGGTVSPWFMFNLNDMI